LFVLDAGATNTIWELPISGGTPTSLFFGSPFRVSNRITYVNHALYVTDNATNGTNGIIFQILLPNPAPFINAVSITTNAVTLNWTSPIYDQFQVQCATNLAPAVWNTFSNVFISTSGAFTFTDTNSPVMAKFYRLVELP
jgi:hypothetical protein